MVIRIKKGATKQEVKKVLQAAAAVTAPPQKKMADFYGKLKGTYGDALTFQKDARDEWR